MEIRQRREYSAVFCCGNNGHGSLSGCRGRLLFNREEMPWKSNVSRMGGTMRLGAYPCKVLGDIMKQSYGEDMISERHRHRYEYNNDYREELINAGLVVAGTSPNGSLVEAVEIPSLDFFIGVQFHPEFKSRPQNAHPIFREFIKAAVKYSLK